MSETGSKAVNAAKGFQRSQGAKKRSATQLYEDGRVEEWMLQHDWSVYQVVPRGEARAIERLLTRGIPAFSPTTRIWVRRRATDRHKGEAEVPALPGYVLAMTRGAQWRLALALPEILGFLSSPGSEEPALLPGEQVRRIAGIGATQGAVAEVRSRLGWYAEVGDPLRVLSGPMEGLTAYLDQELDPDRPGEVAVLVALLGAMIPAKIPALQLAPIK